MLATFKENYQSFSFFKSAICHVAFYLFMIVCHIVMTIRRSHRFRQFTLIFSMI